MLLDHEKELERSQYDEYENSEEEVFGLDGSDEEDEEDEDDMGDLDDDLGGAQGEEDELDLDSKLKNSCVHISTNSQCNDADSALLLFNSI